ncbi:MAG: DUF1674 domain-containing protein [Chloroflexi bacterium]|nr:DUF1674 domain-containing protein [Chloroflexota bacterium]
MSKQKPSPEAGKEAVKETAKDDKAAKPAENTKEIGGPKGPEPTRYGDWERGGKCVDF